MQHSFDTPNPIRLHLELPKGRVRLTAGETEVTRVELTAIRNDPAAQALIDRAEVAQRGEEVVVLVPMQGFGLFGLGGLGGGVEAVVSLPSGSSVDVRTGSAEVSAVGRLGATEVHSGSGTVRLGQTASAKVTTGSGSIHLDGAEGAVEARAGSGSVTVGKVGADARVTTGSGHIEVDAVAGRLKATTGSGNVVVGDAGDALDAFTASGRLRVRRADHGRVRARTASGAVAVGVAGGTAAWLDINTVSGRIRSDLEDSAAPAEGEKTVQLVISTVSGDVEVARA